MKYDARLRPGSPEDEEYEYLGWYRSDEAYKLLKKFDDEGVYAQIEESTGNDNETAVWGDVGANFGSGSQILISVKRGCRDNALQIHERLFGDGSPTEIPERFRSEPGANEAT